MSLLPYKGFKVCAYTLCNVYVCAQHPVQWTSLSLDNILCPTVIAKYVKCIYLFQIGCVSCFPAGFTSRREEDSVLSLSVSCLTAQGWVGSSKSQHYVTLNEFIKPGKK